MCGDERSDKDGPRRRTSVGKQPFRRRQAAAARLQSSQTAASSVTPPSACPAGPHAGPDGFFATHTRQPTACSGALRGATTPPHTWPTKRGPLPSVEAARVPFWVGILPPAIHRLCRPSAPRTHSRPIGESVHRRRRDHARDARDGRPPRRRSHLSTSPRQQPKRCRTPDQTPPTARALHPARPMLGTRDAAIGLRCVFRVRREFRRGWPRSPAPRVHSHRAPAPSPATSCEPLPRASRADANALRRSSAYRGKNVVRNA